MWNKVLTDAARSKAYLSRYSFKLFLLTQTERAGSYVIHTPAVLLKTTWNKHAQNERTCEDNGNVILR